MDDSMIDLTGLIDSIDLDDLIELIRSIWLIQNWNLSLVREAWSV